MAQYQVIIDTNMLQHLFSKDEGLAKQLSPYNCVKREF